jgi:predicted nucleic acid-binding protein
MSQKVVITDAGPLIALSRIEHIHLLKELFTEVFITDTVEQEVLAGGDFVDSGPIRQAIKDGWLQVGSPSKGLAAKSDISTEVEGLDPGEATSILWAAGLLEADQNVMLIMDEAKGRKVARRLSLDTMGSAGIIATARRLGLIKEAQPLLIQLQASGYYLSPTVIKMALQIAGEG